MGIKSTHNIKLINKKKSDKSQIPTTDTPSLISDILPRKIVLDKKMFSESFSYNDKEISWAEFEEYKDLTKSNNLTTKEISQLETIIGSMTEQASYWRSQDLNSRMDPCRGNKMLVDLLIKEGILKEKKIQGRTLYYGTEKGLKTKFIQTSLSHIEDISTDKFFKERKCGTAENEGLDLVKKIGDMKILYKNDYTYLSENGEYAREVFPKVFAYDVALREEDSMAINRTFKIAMESSKEIMRIGKDLKDSHKTTTTLIDNGINADMEFIPGYCLYEREDIVLLGEFENNPIFIEIMDSQYEYLAGIFQEKNLRFRINEKEWKQIFDKNNGKTPKKDINLPVHVYDENNKLLGSVIGEDYYNIYYNDKIYPSNRYTNKASLYERNIKTTHFLINSNKI